MCNTIVVNWEWFFILFYLMVKVDYLRLMSPNVPVNLNFLLRKNNVIFYKVIQRIWDCNTQYKFYIIKGTVLRHSHNIWNRFADSLDPWKHQKSYFALDLYQGRVMCYSCLVCNQMLEQTCSYHHHKECKVISHWTVHS